MLGGLMGVCCPLKHSPIGVPWSGFSSTLRAAPKAPTMAPVVTVGWGGWVRADGFRSVLIKYHQHRTYRAGSCSDGLCCGCC